MQSLKKPPSGGFFYFSPANCAGEKKAPWVQGAFSFKTRFKQLLQIHVQLHTAQGAAVPRCAAAVAHAAQGGGL